MSIEAMKFARDWIAEKPALRPCSAGKVVSMLTTAIAAAEKAESEKDALLLQAQQPLTDEQILDMSVGGTAQCNALLAFARAIEQAHGIGVKND